MTSPSLQSASFATNLTKSSPEAFTFPLFYDTITAMLLNASIYIVFALLLIVSALLLLVVLMQRPKQEGLGAAFGAQMTDQAFGAQTTDVLKKGTVLFGSLFMILCFVLAVLMNRQFQQQKSDLSTGDVAAVQKAEQPQAPQVDLDALAPEPSAPAIAAPAEPDSSTPASSEEAPAAVPADDVDAPSSEAPSGGVPAA